MQRAELKRHASSGVRLRRRRVGRRDGGVRMRSELKIGRLALAHEDAFNCEPLGIGAWGSWSVLVDRTRGHDVCGWRAAHMSVMYELPRAPVGSIP
jgi:hypothetical protein